MIRPDRMAGRDPPYTLSGYVGSKLTVLHGGAGRAPAAESDGALAVAPLAEEDYANSLPSAKAEELRLKRICTARTRATRATAARDAATSP